MTRSTTSEAHLLVAVRAAKVGLWEWNVRTNEVAFSSEWKRQLGYQEHEVANALHEWQSRVHPEDLARVIASLERYLAAPWPDYESEFRMRHKDGSWRWLLSRAELVADEQGALTLMLGSHIDITERKRASEALAESERRLSEAQRLAHIGHFEHDLRTDCAAASPELLRIFGLEPGVEVDTAGLLERVHPEDRPALAATIADLSGGNPQAELRYRVVRGDGSVRIVHARCELRVDADGAPARVFGTVQDITEPEVAALRYEALLNTTVDGVVVTDPSGVILEVNDAYCRASGYARAELLGRSLDVLDAPESAGGSSRALAEVAARGSAQFEAVQRKRDGGNWDVAVSATQLTIDSSRVFMFLRDITRHKRLERELRETVERLRAIFDAEPHCVKLMSRDARLVEINAAGLRLLEAESLDDTQRDLESFVVPEHRAAFKALIARVFEGETAELEFEMIGKKGRRRLMHSHATPLHGAAGTVSGLLAITRDVTDSRRLEQQLREAQKMEAVGRLAGGIAHDFNNMLAVIQMEASLLLADKQDDRTRDGLHQIAAASERAAELTRQLLTFSRRQVKRASASDLREIISGMTKLLARLLGDTIAVEHRFAPNLPPVHADASMMELLFMNLAVNARDAMPRGGRLVVTLDAVSAGADTLPPRARERGGAYVRLRVSDTGAGIASEHLPKIFEPFFTTKDAGKGTGLGLASALSIVEQHEGLIDVRSAPGQGTTFEVLLPALAVERGSVRAARAAARPRNGRETILLVEDDETVRRLARAALESHGYRILEAAAGAQALELWTAQGDEVDLLLTDMAMPGAISGHDLAMRLCAGRPSLRVVYMSGYSEEIVSRGVALDRRHRLLPKPFTVGQLAEIIRESLDEC